MTNNNKTLAELEKEYKQLKKGTSIFIGLLIVLFIATIYNAISNRSFDPLLIVPIVLSAILPANFKKMKSLKDEIESRK